MPSLNDTPLHQLLRNLGQTNNVHLNVDFSAPSGLLGQIKDESADQLVRLKQVSTDAAHLPAIATAVDAVPQRFDALGQRLDLQTTAVISHVSNQTQAVLDRVGQTSDALLEKVHGLLDAQVKTIVEQVTKANEPPPMIAPGEAVVPLLRLLCQIMALCLDKTPGEPSQQPKKGEPVEAKGWKENAMLDRLHDALEEALQSAGPLEPKLAQQVRAAQRHFSTVGLPERGQRFVEVHMLMRDLSLLRPGH